MPCITSFQTLNPAGAISFRPEGEYDFSHYQNYDLQGLVELCERDTTIRDELLGERWKGLWEEKRVQYEAPECSGRLSEAEWALFLMGTICQGCGSFDRKVEIDFFLFKRLCSICRTNGVTTYVDACKRDPSLVEALNYINFTPCPAEGAPQIKARWFWKEDITWLGNFWRELHILLEGGHPGAKQNLDLFKEVCLTNVTMVQENAPLWRDWYLIDQEKKFGRYSDEMTRRQKLAKLVRPRFYAAGRFDIRDINRTIGEESKDLRTALPFRCDLQKLISSEKRMATLYSRLAESVEATRRIRMNLVIQERLSIVMLMWQAWVASLRLSVVDTWAFPGRVELSRQPLIAALLASDRFPTQSDYRKVQLQFQDIAKDFVLATKGVLSNALCSATGADPESADLLELATSVFTPHFATFQAKNHPIIVGWKAYSGWGHTPERTSTECDFDPWLSHVSKGLLDICNLPESATVEDMDREDQRFVCDLCYRTSVARLGPAAHGIAKSIEAEVFTWRLALSHAYAVHQHDRDDLEFSLLVNYGTWSFNVLKEVKIAEELQKTGQGQDPGATRVWLCNHCPEGPSRGAPTTLNNIIKHIRKEHVKTREVNPRDYFLHEGLRLQYERLNRKIPLPIILPASTNSSQSAHTRDIAN